jgi:hypothetical protein
LPYVPYLPLSSILKYPPIYGLFKGSIGDKLPPYLRDNTLGQQIGMGQLREGADIKGLYSKIPQNICRKFQRKSENLYMFFNLKSAIFLQKKAVI